MVLQEEKPLILSDRGVVHDAPRKSHRRPLLHFILLYVLFVTGLDVYRRGEVSSLLKGQKQAAKCPAQGKALLKGKTWVRPWYIWSPACLLTTA
jgi:hypothetical protein